MRQRLLAWEFAQLEQRDDPHGRGRAFEHLVEHVFQQAHFAVRRNPGAAAPRQTDLFASFEDYDYLIEVKWQQSPVDVADIDSLRSRLDRTPSHVIGVFVSMSGFTETALQVVQNRHLRMLLLLDSTDIRTVVDEPWRLWPLLRRKRHHFLVEGKVLLAIADHPWRVHHPLDRTSLPLSDVVLRDRQGRAMPWVVSAGGFGGFVFVQELPDVDWTTAQGSGIGFDLHLPIKRRDDLAYVLDLFNRVGWTSPAGRWTIQQAEVNWHGSGAKGLLDALDDWKGRYAARPAHYHHSEEVTYFDVCDGGFYTFSTALGLTAEGRIRQASLSVQLMGVPLHVEPFRQLVHAFDLDDQAYFRPLAPNQIRKLPLGTQMRVTLNPAAWLCHPREPDDPSPGWVSGLVVHNPFRRAPGSFALPSGDSWRRLLGKLALHGHLYRHQQQRAADEQQGWPESLRETEFLVCDLSSWHEVTDTPTGYYLRYIELVRTGGAKVLYCVADWERLR